ncbi:MAG: amidohydrolase [Oscillospiraceae bacterium]|nr:amidohydrolase [Oscillospiraceae bacterium]
MDFYKRAFELKEETINHRRFFHQNAEAGLDMPNAVSYVTKALKQCGILPYPCGKGIGATVGRGDRVILLRADMDALPGIEESGEEFSSKTNCAHTCGHDLHAAMLLTAAKMLKENEPSLKGTVKLMFQPAEESLQGCKNMIENGILENPKVNAALAFHVTSGRLPIGSFMYNSTGAMMNSADVFKIEVTGKGGHGAYPNLTIDPINIAVKIYSALQALIPCEADPQKSSTLTFGRLAAGETANVIPNSAVLEGSLRTNDFSERNRLFKRISEISQTVANAFNGKAELKVSASVPVLICDSSFTEKTVEYLNSLNLINLTSIPNMHAQASEDFALVAQKVPSAFIYLSAGFNDEKGDYPAHNSKVRFNEAVLPLGSAAFAHIALLWLAKK